MTETAKAILENQLVIMQALGVLLNPDIDHKPLVDHARAEILRRMVATEEHLQSATEE